MTIFHSIQTDYSTIKCAWQNTSIRLTYKQINGTFSWLMIDSVALACSGWCYPKQVVTDYKRNKIELAREKASKQHPSMGSVPVPVSKFLPLLPIIASLLMDCNILTNKCKSLIGQWFITLEIKVKHFFFIYTWRSGDSDSILDQIKSTAVVVYLRRAFIGS